MAETPILVSINNRLVTLQKPSEAIAHMGSVHQGAFRELTFEDLVVRVYIRDSKMPIEQANNSSNDEIIAELKRALRVLGMENVEEELSNAVAAFGKLSQVAVAKRLIPFMQWGL